MFGDVTILVLILPSDLLPARSFWHISMRCIPSWPARTTHLRWSAELLKSTTWRISAIRNSASARHSNVEKVERTQTIYTQLLTWPTEKKRYFSKTFSHLFPFIFFPFFCVHQSSRSRTKPTYFTPCVPPPTMTLCSVSDGEATGDVSAPLPAL